MKRRSARSLKIVFLGLQDSEGKSGLCKGDLVSVFRSNNYYDKSVQNRVSWSTKPPDTRIYFPSKDERRENGRIPAKFGNRSNTRHKLNLAYIPSQEDLQSYYDSKRAARQRRLQEKTSRNSQDYSVRCRWC